MSEGVAAVAFIIDSSLALLGHWPAVLQYYINPLVQRLLTGKDGTLINMGLVTYGTADLYPSPILTKRYFAHPQHVYKELREDPQKLGLGKTNSGGKMGMAALEGYAAAIEMFDLFSRSLQEEIGDKPINESVARFHIIHIMNGAPDESRHPLWNQSTELDTLSWKTMPDELKKRDINLNLIFLRQSSVLSELHSQLVSEPYQPWFMVHPGHSILLASVSSWAPAPTSKRPPEEAPSEVSEESKRPRVSSPAKSQPSPKPPTPQPPAPPAPPALTSTTTAPPTTESTAKQPPAPAVPPIMAAPTMMQILAKVRMLEIELKRHGEELRTALQTGRVQDVEEIKKVFMPKKLNYDKLRQLVNQLSQSQAATRNAAAAGGAAAAGAKQGDAGGSGVGGGFAQSDGNKDASMAGVAGPSGSSTANPPSQASQQAAASVGAPAASDRQSLAQMVQNRFSQPIEKPPILSQNSGAIPNLPPNVPPQVALQYQKLLEQHRVGGPPPPVPSTSFPIAHVQQQPRSIWTGRIEWSGSDQITRARKEVYAEVTAHGQGNVDIRADLWPSVLTLSPSKDQAVHLLELKNWVVQHKPKVCTFLPTARTIPQAVNETNFKSLVSLLVDKKVYAIASWVLPATGTKGEALLIFPGQRGELAGACFPESGIPVYPKPAMSMNPQMQMQMQMPGNAGGGMAPNPSMFSKLPTNQQEFLAMRLAQLRAQGGGNLPNLMNNNNNNNNNMGAWNMDPNLMNQLGGAPMNLAGGSNAPSLAPGFQMQGGMPPNVNPNANLMQQMQQHNLIPPSAGSANNFSLEMLQSLFKRGT